MAWTEWDPQKETKVEWLERNQGATEPFQQGGTAAPGHDIWGMPLPPEPPAAPAAAPAAPAPETTAAGISARATLNSLAQTYGLPADFVERMWGEWVSTKDINAVYGKMVDDPAYNARFPGMKALREKGRAISEKEYVSLEATYAQTMRAYGLPKNLFDTPDDFGRLIGADVSPKELDERVGMAAAAAFSAPVQVREELSRIYDLAPGDLTAYFLDPDRALPLLERQVATAEIGGAARKGGFGLLTRAEAEALQQGGLTGAQAAEGFGEVAEVAPVFSETAEESRSKEQLGRAEQLGYVAGEHPAKARIRRRQEQRQAAFGGGGGAASGGQGTTGLGSASE